jgi:hypothetical protein
MNGEMAARTKAPSSMASSFSGAHTNRTVIPALCPTSAPCERLNVGQLFELSTTVADALHRYP